jgi:hypothetical protein
MIIKKGIKLPGMKRFKSKLQRNKNMELAFVIGFIVVALYHVFTPHMEDTENKSIELWVLVDSFGRIYYTGSEDMVRTIRLNYPNKNELQCVLLTGNRK